MIFLSSVCYSILIMYSYRKKKPDILHRLGKWFGCCFRLSEQLLNSTTDMLCHIANSCCIGGTTATVASLASCGITGDGGGGNGITTTTVAAAAGDGDQKVSGPKFYSKEAPGTKSKDLASMRWETTATL